MHRIRILLAMGTLLFSSLACATVMGNPPPEEQFNNVTEEPLAEDQESPAEGVTCPALTDEIMQVATSESESETESVLDETTLVTYTVNGDEISDPIFEEVSSSFDELQADTEAQQQVWDYYAALIPPENRETIVEYSVFTDGVDNTLAGVSQSYSDPAAWSLQVDIADTDDHYNLTYTLIHEYGHLLTLGPDQVPPSLAVFNNPEDNDIYLKELSACPNYFPGEGCANADSYIDAFYDQFWVELHEEWNQINLEEDPDVLQNLLDDFYDKYQDQFVTDYAVTTPEEDMAESWAFFILSPQPAGDTIAVQKILFFYDYPELVDLRATILGNVCNSFPQ